MSILKCPYSNCSWSIVADDRMLERDYLKSHLVYTHSAHVEQFSFGDLLIKEVQKPSNWKNLDNFTEQILNCWKVKY